MTEMRESGYRDEHAALLAKQAALEDEIARLKAEREGKSPPASSPPKPTRKMPVAAIAVGLVLATAGSVVLFGKGGRTRRIAPSPLHSVQASWQATVTNASGASGVSAGATCTINARLDYRGATFQGVHQTVVTCGGVEIYSERGVFAAGNSREVTYNATKTDGRYDFVLDEKGVATRPHPHASIDTAQGIGLIAGEAPRMSVDLAIVPGSKEARDDAPSR
ncbi:MAG: hypothetical protein BGO98_46170 [Myxococcales bacterium 68-20]|nr:MAG: hypothetical protein BGO98_46170 [Myxococcales bacterium 68-20]